MRLKSFVLIISFFLPILLSGETLYEIYGAPIQGGLLLGKVSPKVESVFYDYQELTLQNNNFILGFDKDEKLDQIITFTLWDGRMFSQRFQIQLRNYDIQNITLPKSKAKFSKTKPPKALNRINLESANLRSARYNSDHKPFRILQPEFAPALANGRVSSKFGSQRIVNNIPPKPHSGLDIAVPEGTLVHAMSAGTVILTGDYYYNGKFVLIDHGLGLSSIYLHLSEILVKADEKIELGTDIGKVGSTGISTGPHLHWGVKLSGQNIDPATIKNLDHLFMKFSIQTK